MSKTQTTTTIPLAPVRWREQSRAKDQAKNYILQQMVKTLEAQVSAEINSEIIISLCLTQGWYQVVVKGEQSIAEMKEWCILHCQASYHVFYDRTVFKSQDDFVLFCLTWG